jgi:hypothetical protein
MKVSAVSRDSCKKLPTALKHIFIKECSMYIKSIPSGSEVKILKTVEHHISFNLTTTGRVASMYQTRNGKVRFRLAQLKRQLQNFIQVGNPMRSVKLSEKQSKRRYSRTISIVERRSG